MGIHGIYKEIGPGKRIALSKLSVEHYIAHSRPLRLAIDISIWLFQIQAGQGGSNPALRTFYYRLLRLLTLNIHPLFVFDGPNKPLFKRNKRVGGGHVKVASVPEFLAKQLLKQFGFPMHLAPGEAEAECALLQREGIVDAVLSEDVDTLMFGSGMTMRSWSAEMKSSKVPTHINLYDAKVTKETSGLDREGMILVALMSGGDYIPEGIPGCGPKTACEAARAGFGADLVKIDKKDEAGFAQWRERLSYELRTNESKLFRQRKNLTIPDDFPNKEVLGYYTHPVISGPDKLDRLRRTLKWDQPLDFPSLRVFTVDAFDWTCLGGAKKFIRNLAPAMLIRELRLRAEQGDNDGEDLSLQEASEARLINAIHGRRNHASTDNTNELRISFVPMNLVDIDLSIEDPDEEATSEATGDDDEIEGLGDECPGSPTKKRGPSTYDPTVMEKVWVLETWLRHGVPLKVQDWEASFRDPKTYLAMKSAAKESTKRKPAAKKASKVSNTQAGALDRFTQVSKPGLNRVPATAKVSHLDSVDLSEIPSSVPAQLPSARSQFGFPRASQPNRTLDEVDLAGPRIAKPTARPAKRRSPEPASPLSLAVSPSVTPKPKRVAQAEVIDLLSSSPLREAASPTPRKTQQVEQRVADSFSEVELPDTVTKRRKRSPFRRYHTMPESSGNSLLTPSVSRSSTPPLAFVDEVDLAEDLPSPTLLGIRPDARKEPLSRVTSTTRATSPLQCRDIPTWIRRSQSVTPGKARHADTLAALPAPPLFKPREEIIEDVDLSETRPGVGALLPAARRLKERDLSPEKPLTNATKPGRRPKAKATEPDTGIFKRFAQPASASTVQVPRLAKMTQPEKSKKKRQIILRQSLEGAWKEIEVDSLDLSGVGPNTNVESRAEVGSSRSRWRRSEVEVLDLTGDD
ncbi:hypothetical protein MBLNU457_4382t1 [Dothideomycetes sp. NU457]